MLIQTNILLRLTVHSNLFFSSLSIHEPVGYSPCPARSHSATLNRDCTHLHSTLRHLLDGVTNYLGWSVLKDVHNILLRDFAPIICLVLLILSAQ